MATQEMRVFAWVGDEWDVEHLPRTLPSVRVWGDAVLELIAVRRSLALRPPLSLRRAAVFGWLEPVPPEGAALDTAGRDRVELLVDAAACARARVDLVHSLFDPVSWLRLHEWLVERGHDAGRVDEEIVPVIAPTAGMFVDRGRSAVESTPHDLLDEVLDYFEPAAVGYLDTWGPLLDPPLIDEGAWEVVVPAEAVMRKIS